MEIADQRKGCLRHPQSQGVAFCKRCNGYICRDCIIVVEGKGYCKKCYHDSIQKKNNANKCINHPNKPGIAFCRKCGGHLCQECMITKDNKKYCKLCYDKSVHDRVTRMQNSGKILCDYCGREIEENSRSCQWCGAILSIKQHDFTNMNEENVETTHEIAVAENEQISAPHINRSKSLLNINFIWTLITIIALFTVSLLLFIDSITVFLSFSKLLYIAFTITFSIIIIIGSYYLNNRIRKNSPKLISQTVIILIAISITCTIFSVLQVKKISITEQHLNQGLILLKSRQFQDALSAFDKANKSISGYKDINQLIIETKNNIVQSTVDSCLNIAEIRIIEKKIDEAISLIDHAITLAGITQKISNSYVKLIPVLSNDAKSFFDKDDFYPAMWNAQKVIQIGQLTSPFTASKFSEDLEKAKNIYDNASRRISLRKLERDKQIAQKELAEKVQQVIDSVGEKWRKRAEARKNTILRLMEKYPYWDYHTIGCVACNLFFIGMTKEQLIESMGQPDDINITAGSWGTHEQWIYGDYDGTYIYLENGVVTSYQK